MSLKGSLLSLMLLTFLPTAGWAAGEAFTQARFEALQKEGAIVLIDVAASWCPTCARQNAILEQYRAEKPDVPLHVLRVDFDSQKEWVTYFKAPRQSTLVLYKGTERLWFAVAETRSHVIFKVIDDAAAGA